MRRQPTNRKYRPSLEQFESKQLLSGGVLSQGTQTLLQTAVPTTPQTQHVVSMPNGTGKGGVIPTG